jgi:hypothetical protein
MSLKRLLAAGGKQDETMMTIGTSRTTPMLGALSSVTPKGLASWSGVARR